LLDVDVEMARMKMEGSPEKFCEGFPPFPKLKTHKRARLQTDESYGAGLDPVSATQLGVWLPLEGDQGRLKEVRELPKTNQGGTPY
jgi:hypothetical protein